MKIEQALLMMATWEKIILKDTIDLPKSSVFLTEN
jgi:hypothetical protein